MSEGPFPAGTLQDVACEWGLLELWVQGCAAWHRLKACWRGLLIKRGPRHGYYLLLSLQRWDWALGLHAPRGPQLHVLGSVPAMGWVAGSCLERL